jgi:uncharacterized membrane protein
MAYICIVITVFFLAAHGVTFKLSNRMKCDGPQVNFMLFVTATVFMVVWVLATGTLTPVRSAAVVGACMGISGFLSVAAFRAATAKGKISTSWTILQLSLVIPVAASIVIWSEVPKARHYAGFLLTLVAILLLGIDMGRVRE